MADCRSLSGLLQMLRVEDPVLGRVRVRSYWSTVGCAPERGHADMRDGRTSHQYTYRYLVRYGRRATAEKYNMQYNE